MEAKAQGWLRAGVALVWVLFPHSQVVHIHRVDGRDEILGAEDMLTGEELLPGFAVKISDVMPLEISPA